ncbi:hypothetical protein, partial [Paenibacillus tundrae]|uniref:hypothetical protein n=1 Tax=Paenibacillus tundrae TaxID=528187 RepID=UPI0022A92BED
YDMMPENFWEIDLPEIHVITPNDSYIFTSHNELITSSGTFEEDDLNGVNKFKKCRLENIRKFDPWEGMNSVYLKQTAWGLPTEIVRPDNYDSLRPDRKWEMYKWVLKNEYGEIYEIRTAHVTSSGVLSIDIAKYTTKHD